MEGIEHVGKELFKVQSSSNPDEYYYVDVVEKKCTCRGFMIRKKCTHIEDVREFIEKNKIKVEGKK